LIHFSEEILIDATPKAIFSVYENVNGWCKWDPDVQSSSISGPFVAGTTGKLKPMNGPLVKMRLTHVERENSFTDETSLPLCTMRFEHRLISEGRATRVQHSISFSGVLSFFFGRVIGKQLRIGLPHALEGLKSLAENAQTT
jgi:hypothetical protein